MCKTADRKHISDSDVVYFLEGHNRKNSLRYYLSSTALRFHKPNYSYPPNDVCVSSSKQPEREQLAPELLRITTMCDSDGPVRSFFQDAPWTLSFEESLSVSAAITTWTNGTYHNSSRFHCQFYYETFREPSFKFGVVGPQNLQLEASRPITMDENSKPKPRLKVADEQTLFSSSSRITTAYSTCLATNFSVAS